MADKTNPKQVSLDQLQSSLSRAKLDSVRRIQELLEIIINYQGAENIGVTVTLPADRWSGRTQTIHNDIFRADSSCCYFVCGDADNFMECSDAGIRANNITTDGEITFRCEIIPDRDLTVHILRLEVAKANEQQ